MNFLTTNAISYFQKTSNDPAFIPDVEGSNIVFHGNQTVPSQGQLNYSLVPKTRPSAAQGGLGRKNSGNVQNTSTLQVLDLSQLNPQNIQHGMQQLTQMLPNQAYTVLSTDPTGAVSQ